VQIDEDVNEKILNYVSSHQCATAQELNVERSRVTIRIHGPQIAKTESCFQEMADMVKVLEQAALREPETIEGRAMLDIDVGVMRGCLATTREIIQVAQTQLERARAM
jgi:hypothetical protein